MIDFRYQGAIPASKSLMNRALIVQSYFPSLVLLGHSECDDVTHMHSSIAKLGSQSHLDCGEGGTTFRFLALRASRIPGEHLLTGTARLLSRPQKQLLDILNQLGVSAEISFEGLRIKTQGCWKKPAQTLKIDATASSQFASAVILNAWSLDFDLEFELVGTQVSESYFEMTLSLLKDLGMTIEQSGMKFRIPARQKISQETYAVEPDMSSTFTIAVAAALCGEVQIENYPVPSLQPDSVFTEIFDTMKVSSHITGNVLAVKKSSEIKACDWDLSSCPDLFPVLAVLAAHADGQSRFFGAPHLVAKESDRIQKVADLFDLIGVSYNKLSDGMEILGSSKGYPLVSSGLFDPDQDHRMVMAAMIFRMLGHQFHIQEPQAINKSFPEFWSIVGMHA